MPREHLAIVTASIADALRTGEKTIESRLSRTRRPPLGCVRTGDWVYFRTVGGPVVGRCRVRQVRELFDLQPAHVEHLARLVGAAVAAPAAYWERRRHCRHAVLLWLGPLQVGAPGWTAPRQYGSGWYTRPEAPVSSGRAARGAGRRARSPRRSGTG